MIPSTVGGDVTCAEAPVTSHPVMPIAVVATISDVFLKRCGLFEPLSVSTLPPASCLARLQAASERPESRGAIEAHGHIVKASVQSKMQAVHPHLSYKDGRTWDPQDQAAVASGRMGWGLTHDGPPLGAARRSSSRVYGVLLSQEAEDALRGLVGLGQHAGAGLLQDLQLGEGDHLGGHVHVADAALGGGQVLLEGGQVVE